MWNRLSGDIPKGNAVTLPESSLLLPKIQETRKFHRYRRALAAPLSTKLRLGLSCTICPLPFESCCVVSVSHHLRSGFV